MSKHLGFVFFCLVCLATMVMCVFLIIKVLAQDEPPPPVEETYTIPPEEPPLDIPTLDELDVLVLASDPELLPYLRDYVTSFIGNRCGDYELAGKASETILFWAKELDIDPCLVLAIMERESSCNPNARGAAGEYSWMQVHPGWSYDSDIYRGEGAVISLSDPLENIKVGMLIYKAGDAGNTRRALGYYNGGTYCNLSYADLVLHGGSGKFGYYQIVTNFWRLWLWPEVRNERDDEVGLANDVASGGVLPVQEAAIES